jgi:hypothetical protein
MPIIENPTFYDIRKISSDISQKAKTPEEKHDAVRRFIINDSGIIYNKFALYMTPESSVKFLANQKLIAKALSNIRPSRKDIDMVQKILEKESTERYLTKKPQDKDNVNDAITNNLKRLTFSLELLDRLSQVLQPVKPVVKPVKEDSQDYGLFEYYAGKPRKQGKRKTNWIWIVLLVLLALAWIWYTYKQNF